MKTFEIIEYYPPATTAVWFVVRCVAWYDEDEGVWFAHSLEFDQRVRAGTFIDVRRRMEARISFYLDDAAYQQKSGNSQRANEMLVLSAPWSEHLRYLIALIQQSLRN